MSYHDFRETWASYEGTEQQDKAIEHLWLQLTHNQLRIFLDEFNRGAHLSKDEMLSVLKSMMKALENND